MDSIDDENYTVLKYVNGIKVGSKHINLNVVRERKIWMLQDGVEKTISHQYTSIGDIEDIQFRNESALLHWSFREDGSYSLYAYEGDKRINIEGDKIRVNEYENVSSRNSVGHIGMATFSNSGCGIQRHLMDHFYPNTCQALSGSNYYCGYEPGEQGYSQCSSVMNQIISNYQLVNPRAELPTAENW